MPALVAGIHVLVRQSSRWWPGQPPDQVRGQPWRPKRSRRCIISTVMRGLVPRIHVFTAA